MSTDSRTSLPVVWSRARRLTRRGVLWLGLRCDVRWKFCYDELVAARDKAWMPPEQVIRALDKLRRYYGNEFVDLMGGEPTLHPQILDIVAHAACIGLRPTLITHGMRLADPRRVRDFAAAGIHDVLISVHGIGETAAAIHGRSRNNFAKQMAALGNLRALGIPFRFNVTMIRDNLTQLPAIAELAAEQGARVVNFLSFNPYFEWLQNPEIPFQVRHSEIAPFLADAIDVCTANGIEANVRYLPPCQLPGREAHIYTGYQLPYDPHEWDYNSWYDTGHHGQPPPAWYLQAADRQRQRHHYQHVPACQDCALRQVCDGFHAQYLARFGETEATAYPGEPVTDPTHFVRHQTKLDYRTPPPPNPDSQPHPDADRLAATQLPIGADGRAGATRPATPGR